MRVATMPHVSPAEEPSVAERLAADMEKAGFRIRTLARVLAGSDADHAAIENKRKSVRGWLQQGVLPNDANAEELAAALGQPADRYKTPPEIRARRKDEIADLQQRVSELETLLADVQKELRSRPRARARKPAG